MPDINQNADLVERLRALNETYGLRSDPLGYCAGFCREAADAIEALVRERDEARTQVSLASDPAYLATVIDKVGMVDAEWKVRAESAAAEISRLRDDLALRDDLLIKAEKFRFAPSLTVESRGPSQWAVCDTGEVQNAAGEWEREPQPSSRSVEFIARTRFTFAEAVRRARTALEAQNGRS